MGGVVAGGATLYVPKELPLQDRKFLEQAALERKVAGAQLVNGEGTYKTHGTDYTKKY